MSQHLCGSPSTCPLAVESHPSTHKYLYELTMMVREWSDSSQGVPIWFVGGENMTALTYRFPDMDNFITFGHAFFSGVVIQEQKNNSQRNLHVALKQACAVVLRNRACKIIYPRPQALPLRDHSTFDSLKIACRPGTRNHVSIL